jgi:hypothetical protein
MFDLPAPAPTSAGSAAARPLSVARFAPHPSARRLQALGGYLAGTTHVSIGVTLALLAGPPAPGAPGAARRALLLRPQAAAGHFGPGGAHAAAAGAGAGAASAPVSPLAVSALELAGTLLSTAVSQRTVVTIRNRALFLQHCLVPAPDLFPEPSLCPRAAAAPAAALLVAPLMSPPPPAATPTRAAAAGRQPAEAAREPLGALYFTLPEGCNAGALRGRVVGLAHTVTAAVGEQLRGAAATLLERCDARCDEVGPMAGATACGSVHAFLA